jgi:signal transduction histidine kinase
VKALAMQVDLLSRRLIEVQESELRQLSRELHDRVGQNLTALAINLDILKSLLMSDERHELRRRLDDCINLVDATADAIEDVMAEVRPPVLDGTDLLSELQLYAQEYAQRTRIEVVVSGTPPSQRATRDIEITLFRIAQEALNNVAKHARTHRVQVKLLQTDGECALRISDQGVGFDVKSLEKPAARGRGIQSMRERAEAVGGGFEVRTSPGKGTEIIVRVPVQRPAEES